MKLTQVETSVAMEMIVKEARRMYSVMSVTLVEEVMPDTLLTLETHIFSSC